MAILTLQIGEYILLVDIEYYMILTWIKRNKFYCQMHAINALWMLLHGNID